MRWAPAAREVPAAGRARAVAPERAPRQGAGRRGGAEEVAWHASPLRVGGGAWASASRRPPSARLSLPGQLHEDVFQAQRPGPELPQLQAPPDDRSRNAVLEVAAGPLDHDPPLAVASVG